MPGGAAGHFIIRIRLKQTGVQCPCRQGEQSDARSRDNRGQQPSHCRHRHRVAVAPTVVSVTTLHRIAAGMLLNLSGCAFDSAKNISEAAITSTKIKPATVVSSWLPFNRMAMPYRRPPGKYRASFAERGISRTASRNDRLRPSPVTSEATTAVTDGISAGASINALGEPTYRQR